MQYVNHEKHSGLSKLEVENSRKKHGENQIITGRRKRFFTKYLENLGNPTIKILLIAMCLNLIFFIQNLNRFETIGIALIIIVATFISSISEYGSQLAFEKLIQETQKTKCKVVREGKITERFATEVVVGDIIKLEPGDKIPADGFLIEGSINVDESPLNGEIKEVYKETNGSLFNGSIVCEGEGLMVIQAVGNNTYYGKLAKELMHDEIKSNCLKESINEVAKTMSNYGYLGAILVLIASLFKSAVIDNGYNLISILIYFSEPYAVISDVLRAVTLALTIIVVAVPEGLPVMLSVILSSNIKKMIKNNVLVRKPEGINTAGSLNILFTDKTGTLTKGKLKVNNFINGENLYFNNLYKLKEEKELWKLIYVSSVYNNASELSYNGRSRVAVGGNTTDRALLDFAATYPLLDINIQKVKAVPFSSNSKLSLTEIKGDMNLTLIKGAPEKILPYCSHYYDTKGNKGNFINNFTVNKTIKEMSSKGIRVIVLATSQEKIDSLSKKLNNLTFVGIVGIKDEVRENVKKSVKEVMDAGIQVVMITGDGKETAFATAVETGLINKDSNNSLITSNELNTLSDEEVIKLLPSLRVVARALPSDKTRLIKLSQHMGLVTGMTGDGINDAPALKRADVSFSMGSGAEVAKETSDIVILDNNFLSIGKAILYGRTIFKNMQKFIAFQLLINMCVVLISLIGQFINIELPITIVQLLWVNMVIDTLAGIAFAGEAPLHEYMKEKPKVKDEKIINSIMKNQIILTGIFTTILCLLFLKLPNVFNIFRFSPSNNFLMTGFFALFMFCTIFNLFNTRTQGINILSNILKNKSFIIVISFISIVQLWLLYNGKSVFRTYGLNEKEFFTALSLAFTVIPFDLMRKSFLKLRYSIKN